MSRSLKPAGTLVLLSAMSLGAAAAHAELRGRIIEEFQRASNDETPIGVTDGNPLAATSVFATSMYRQLGFDFTRPEHFDISLNAGAGQFTSGKLHSDNFASGDLSMGFSFGDRIGLVATIPVEWRETFNLNTYIGGAGLAVPIVILNDQYHWTVSPWAIIGVADGSDLAQGGIQYGGGATSLLSTGIADNRLRLSMANQASYFSGEPFGYSSLFDFEQNVSQFILKNGFELSGKFANAWEAYASISYTNFCKAAFVDSYWTPEIGLRYAGKHFEAGVAAFGDAGNHYSSYGLRGGLTFQW